MIQRRARPSNRATTGAGSSRAGGRSRRSRARLGEFRRWCGVALDREFESVAEIAERARVRSEGMLLDAPATLRRIEDDPPLLERSSPDSGGLLCHVTVIAREYGIPAVVSTCRGTSTIPDGATVEVNPMTGSVTVLS